MNKLDDDLKEYKVSTLNYILIILFSFFLSLFIIIGPILIFVNLLIYHNYVKLLIFLIALTAQIGVSLFLKFYIEGISMGKIENKNKYLFSFSTLTFLLMIIIVLIIYSFI